MSTPDDEAAERAHMSRIEDQVAAEYDRNAPVVFETFGECQDPDCDGECAGERF